MNNTHLNEEGWYRLSMLSVVFFIGKTVTKILKDALPGMAPLFVIAFSSDDKTTMTALIVLGVVTLTLVNAVLQFWFFKYKVEKNRVLINDGVFKKNHRIIQFDRIQNINILQPFYFKPFRLVTLQIETAGAKGNEADLAGLKSEYANEIRQQVLKYKTTHASSARNELSEQSEEENILAESNIANLAKYGVSSNGIFWFFVIIAPFAGFADEVLERWFDKDDFVYLAEVLGGGISGNILMFVLGALAVITLMLLFSILGAIFRYYKYQLTLNKNNLKRSSGLLTNYQESLKLGKIQAITTQTNFIGVWLKVQNLILGQLSNSHAQNKKKSLFVIPARTEEQSNDLKDSLLEDCPNNIQTVGISKRYITKTVLLKLFLPSLILSVPAFLNTESIFVFFLPVVVSLLFLPLVFRRWKKYRFGMSEGYAQFERGLFGFRHVVFPLFKVQKVEVTQSPIQRRNNLATLKIYLASNKLQMQYIPYDKANEWMQVILGKIQSTKKAWY